MKIALTLIVFLNLSGCKIVNGQIVNDESKRLSSMRGELRIELFKECMRLAADVNKAKNTHYSDLNEVVSDCSNQALRNLFIAMCEDQANEDLSEKSGRFPIEDGLIEIIKNAGG